VAGEDVRPELLAEVSTLAHAPRVIGVYRRDDLPRGTRPVTLALWHVADPGNVGTLIRSADAFGAGIALSPACARSDRAESLAGVDGRALSRSDHGVRCSRGPAHRPRPAWWNAAWRARARR